MGMGADVFQGLSSVADKINLCRFGCGKQRALVAAAGDEGGKVEQNEQIFK